MNKGTTLIELMIVIAIMGIIFCFIPFKETFRQYNLQEQMLKEQAKVLQFKKMLFKLLKETKSFSKVNSRQIFTENFRLTVSKNKTKLSLNGKIFKFNKFEFYNFSKINDSLVTCTIKNGNSAFDIYLIAGNYPQNNNKQTDDKKQIDEPVEMQKEESLPQNDSNPEVNNEE